MAKKENSLIGANDVTLEALADAVLDWNKFHIELRTRGWQGKDDDTVWDRKYERMVGLAKSAKGSVKEPAKEAA